MDGVGAAAEAITKAGPVGWWLLSLLIISLLLCTGAVALVFKWIANALREIRNEGRDANARALSLIEDVKHDTLSMIGQLKEEGAAGRQRTLELVGSVKDSVADLRAENNKQFAEMNQHMMTELGNVRERLGRLEGAAGIMAPPFVGGKRSAD